MHGHISTCPHHLYQPPQNEVHYLPRSSFPPSQALSQESADPDFLEDYDTFIPEWEVEVSPGGPTVALNGTIEEVHAELLKLNLSCDEDYLEPETDEEASELEKRTDCSGSKLMCFVNGYTWADSVAIKDGIIYLRKLKGRPINGAGLNASGRVSCSYNYAIYWCNDVGKHRPRISFPG
ncbi:hypothetical protein ACJ41O_011968 [Fusarium nematophilum]